MLNLDHLTIVAPSLEVGAAYVRDQLGIDMPSGGKHPEMATHNLVLRLSDEVFMEVIAMDPDVERPKGPRWFGLDDADAIRSAWDDGRRLRGWVAKTDDIDTVLARHGVLLGTKTRVSRGERSWLFSVLPDGSLPVDGIAPSIVDREGRPGAISTLPQLGANLLSFQIEHPNPDWVLKLYATLGVENPPTVLKGAQVRYRAIIETPSGIKELC
ncbi:VOC family protein [Paraburkholderia aspalathi]|uniref:VOC family protein n=1 Tax=Paraburkholderia aspalathi TaxID=1324617 RepID=UPI0038BDE22D